MASSHDPTHRSGRRAAETAGRFVALLVGTILARLFALQLVVLLVGIVAIGRSMP
ncbi:MAG: hypothetical protein RIB53_06600 [Roseitalea porphyridii]|uniref:hypothetical protein n=1 Tax=Roseitalea porphyridii TaxID=1852022 RepID=UPI0032EAE90E